MGNMHDQLSHFATVLFFFKKKKHDSHFLQPYTHSFQVLNQTTNTNNLKLWSLKKIQFNTKKFKRKISGPLIRSFQYLSYYSDIHKGSSKAEEKDLFPFPTEDMIQEIGELHTLETSHPSIPCPGLTTLVTENVLKALANITKTKHLE